MKFFLQGCLLIAHCCIPCILTRLRSKGFRVFQHTAIFSLPNFVGVTPHLKAVALPIELAAQTLIVMCWHKKRRELERHAATQTKQKLCSVLPRRMAFRLNGWLMAFRAYKRVCHISVSLSAAILPQLRAVCQTKFFER